MNNQASGAGIQHIAVTPTAEFYTGERCHITEMLNHPNSPDVSIARARVLPGITTELHCLLETHEQYVIESGKGEMQIDGRRVHITANDIVDIPAGVPQQITNVGAENLVFLCVCRPRFQTQCYRSLE